MDAPAPAGRGRPKNSKRKAAKDAAAAAAAAALDKKQRKAARQGGAAPPSIDLNTTHPALNNLDAPTVARTISSNSPDQVASALNSLLRASADVDVNYCLGPGGEKILLALVKLFDEVIGWDDEDIDGGDNSSGFTVASWNESSLSGIYERWSVFCRNKLASPLASSSDPNMLIDPETDARILDMIIAILRNLSFVAQNLRFLYYTKGVMRILIGALYYRGYVTGGGGAGDERSGEDVPSSAHNSNMCVHSIQTLTNMAPIIDVTGRQLFVDRIFLESDAKEIKCTIPGQEVPPNEAGDALTTTAGAPNIEEGHPEYGISSFLGFGGMYLAKQYDTKAETLDNIPDSVVWGLVGPHVRATLAMFPALTAVLDPNDTTTTTTSPSGWHRPSVQALLDLLAALIENPDNKGIFLCIPDSFLHRLTEMLFLPRLGPDSMDYIDPVSNTVARVVALKLMAGYDATIDSDMRDRSCALLVNLTDLSTGIKRRLGMASSISGMTHRQYDSELINTSVTMDGLAPSILRSDESSSSRRMNVRLYDSLLSMVSSTSGRGDAGQLAVRLLSNLALIPENNAGIRYVERKLISMSVMDPHIAKIACNGIFNRIK
ncbi:hypothetical protein ACHAXA_008478 [Cyclostephanos tholiformis]|uniref:Uncharacterized protein n=1 Tax=Cyclostephanos tholiformis TaxID=382380 RepID=A0ABD3SBB5_9STRA